MQMILGDNLHEMSKHISWEKLDIFRTADCWIFYLANQALISSFKNSFKKYKPLKTYNPQERKRITKNTHKKKQHK